MGAGDLGQEWLLPAVTPSIALLCSHGPLVMGSSGKGRFTGEGVNLGLVDTSQDSCLFPDFKDEKNLS